MSEKPNRLSRSPDTVGLISAVVALFSSFMVFNHHMGIFDTYSWVYAVIVAVFFYFFYKFIIGLFLLLGIVLIFSSEEARESYPKFLKQSFYDDEKKANNTSSENSWTICNLNYTNGAEVAIAYKNPFGVWISRGWITIPYGKGKCIKVQEKIEGDYAYYYHRYSKTKNLQQQATFCTLPRSNFMEENNYYRQRGYCRRPYANIPYNKTVVYNKRIVTYL